MVALHGGPVTPYEVQLEREVIQEEMVRLQAQTVSASLQNMLKMPSGHPVATLVPYDHAVIVPLFKLFNASLPGVVHATARGKETRTRQAAQSLHSHSRSHMAQFSSQHPLTTVL